MTADQTSTSQSYRRKDKTLLAVAVAIALIVIAGLLAAFFIKNSINPVATPVVWDIADGNLTINAGSYECYNFTVPSGASDIKVDGTFAVSGGSGNVIKVYVMSDANFADWQNGRNVSMYYNSGEANSGVISATPPSAGTYYLVYDNTFSTISKNVTTQVDFYYT
jgi:hypothetical protein